MGIKATNTPPPLKQFCCMIEINQKDMLFFVLDYHKNNVCF